MIGRFLNQFITGEEEDRVLCTVMRPGSYSARKQNGPCLVGVIADICDYVLVRDSRFGPTSFDNIEMRYDALCKRFGTSQVNNVIRDRILSNRVKKALKETLVKEILVEAML